MDDYRLLWEALTKEPGNSLALAQLLMLFLGLTAEEVCALDSEDLLPIPNYRAYQLRITKRCIPIKKNDNDKNYIVSGELPSSESYRNVPVPFLLVKLITLILITRINNIICELRAYGGSSSGHSSSQNAKWPT